MAVAGLQADAHSLAAVASNSQDTDVAAITAPLKEGSDALANLPAGRTPAPRTSKKSPQSLPIGIPCGVFLRAGVLQCGRILHSKGMTVLSKRATPERLSAFSDAVFAVLITVLVLELRPPEHPTFTALLSLWPTWLSYAVSYLFIAIVWANHHHLMRYATETTYRLMWFNFAHLFSVSLLPLSTAWMAVSELAPQPVSFYAAVFFLVNLTYIFLIWECIDRTPLDELSPRVRRIMRIRSIVTLCVFGLAAVVALKYPLVGLGMCCCCLIVYLKPDAPGASA